MNEDDQSVADRVLIISEIWNTLLIVILCIKEVTF